MAHIVQRYALDGPEIGTSVRSRAIHVGGGDRKKSPVKQVTRKAFFSTFAFLIRFEFMGRTGLQCAGASTNSAFSLGEDGLILNQIAYIAGRKTSVRTVPANVPPIRV